MAAGLVPMQATADATPSAQASQMDPMLARIVAGMRAKVPTELATAYQQVIVAGMKVMYSPNTRHLLIERLSVPGPLYTKVAHGIADLLLVIYKESNRKMSIPAAIMASTELMCQALDMAAKAQSLKLTPDIVAACTHATASACLQKFGIGPAAIQNAIASGRQAQQQHKG